MWDQRAPHEVRSEPEERLPIVLSPALSIAASIARNRPAGAL